MRVSVTAIKGDRTADKHKEASGLSKTEGSLPLQGCALGR